MLTKLIKSLLALIATLVFTVAAVWFCVTQPSWSRAQQTTLPTVQPKKLRQHVKILSEILPGRSGIESDLTPTLTWLESKVLQYSTPYRQSYQSDGQEFHNLILEFGPATGSTLVIGAHYDTAHGLPGADDNASGVAGLIELARLLSETAVKRRVELVFYTLEESRFNALQEMGSYIHAESLRNSGREVDLMISLEMIGYYSDQPDSQTFPIEWMKHLYTDRGDFIGVISDLGNMPAVRTVKNSFKRSIGDKLPVYSLNGPAGLIPGIGASDHRSYWELGYPAVMVSDTAYFRNMAYHTAQDTADRLDYEKMALVVQATYQLVMDMNQAEASDETE